ncbi:MAG: hypothetical protein ORN51_04260 [Akkermansiaceae bacterium]|jgi:hypothetical protein|nr:hypothetical protein [Akkermansiaceae bacterium]
MKKLLPSVLLVIVLALVVFFIRTTKPAYVSMNGVTYEVKIYSIDNNYSFSLFENRENELARWKNNNIILAIACLEGASFILELSQQELNKLFEKPSDNLNKLLKSNAEILAENAREKVAGLSLEITVRITRVVSAKAEGITYIIVNSEKMIDNAPIKSTNVLIETNNSWKCMSGKRDPNGDLVHSLVRVSEEVSEMSRYGKIKPIRPDF